MIISLEHYYKMHEYDGYDVKSYHLVTEKKKKKINLRTQTSSTYWD